MQAWYLPVDKKRQQAAHTPSITDENLRHFVSTASTPGVFQIALFKGFPNIPHIPAPPQLLPQPGRQGHGTVWNTSKAIGRTNM